jgi:S-adenosyl-L-methionine hydrolase (adenosine-forming)
MARKAAAPSSAEGAAARAGWVTFLSDYGLDDVFVGVCKGVMARIAPDLKIIDLCHLVPPQDIAQGAAVLAAGVNYLPPAVHLGLVDPLGTTPTRGIAVRAADGSQLVGPDNGVLSLAWQALGGAVAAHVLENQALWLDTPSKTFRGRDIFAPVAAHLAADALLADVGPEVPVQSLVQLTTRDATVDDDHVHGEVRHVDHFGNLSLNIARADLEAAGITLGDTVEVRCTGRSLTVPFTPTYGDVAPGRLALCEDAFRWVTLAVNQGRAAGTLKAGPGEPVVVSRVPQPIGRRPGHH